LAIAYAQYIACTNKQEWDSCGLCPSCRKFEKLSHPDLHLIFPNSTTVQIKKDSDSQQLRRDFVKYTEDHHYHIALEDWLLELGGENKQASINIRDCNYIIEQNSSKSYEGGYKFFILWMVERLYYAAAPKLLKTLEEPEDKTLFILIAENSDHILSTILSRTQLIKIPKLTDEMLTNALMTQLSVSEGQAQDIAQISDGNYHKAINLLQKTDDMLFMINTFDSIFKSAIALSKKENKQQINYLQLQDILNSITKQGREFQKSFFLTVTRLLRNILLMSTHNEFLVKATAAEKMMMETMKPYINLKNISPIIEECNQAIYHIERNANTNLLLNDFYLKLSKALTN
jgi:DNA polymerase-3 subunit delta'